MSSPEVWADVRSRVGNAALLLGAVGVAWPNETFTEPQPFDALGNPQLWVAVEIHGDAGESIELDGLIEQETGTVLLHVQVPKGAGIAGGLALRKGLLTLFRKPQGLPPGLVYLSAAMDPGASGDEVDGKWWKLTGRRFYRYQDKLVTD